MPSSDYTTTGGGLKLKGASVEKNKKKKKKRPKQASTAEPSTTTELSNPTRSPSEDPAPRDQRESTRELAEQELRALKGTSSSGGAGGRYKTEAEKRHEEMRRKRLDEKLRKEGVKTHKERVEELNRYLSGLSEHHDMPKIGPG